MQSFPMFIKTSGRRFVVAGQGEQAAQKCRLLLKTDVQIDLLANAPEDELQALINKGRVQQKSGEICPESFSGAPLVFIATGSPVADVCLHELAKQAGVLVNVVDRPALCDMTTPSIVDRDPVVVAIGTEGTAPVLARRIKTRVEQMLDPNIGRFAEAAGNLRDMASRYVPSAQRRAFWREVFTGSIWKKFKSGAERQAIAELKEMIRNRHVLPASGTVTIIDTSAGAADLISVRAVERLQEADDIFFETHSDQAILEFARRDAERHLLGGASGTEPWPTRMSVSFVKRAASTGKNVVWLRNCQTAGNEIVRLTLKSDAQFQVEYLLATPAETAEKQDQPA